MADPIKAAPDVAPSEPIARSATPATKRAKARDDKGIPTLRAPRWGFFKGLLTGAVIEVPAIAFGVWWLGRMGVGDATLPFMRILRLTAIFTGIAAVFTAAGIGRLAAQASATGGRKRAVWVAGRAHAAASIGLVIIAVIPHGHLPERSWLWLAYPLTGIVVGAACGALIGAVCGGATPVGFSDVFALAKRPSDVLRNLLAPEDLVKLGIALRDRTSNLLEGLFEPAPLPPGSEEPKPPPKTAPPKVEPKPEVPPEPSNPE